MLTQSEYMRKYNESHREEFNDIFFQRSNQEIMDCVKKVILSCERDKYFTLKVLDMKEIYDYEEIYNVLRDHDEKRRKKNSKEENQYDYINIKDSDIMLLQVKFFIAHNGIEPAKDKDGNPYKIKNPWKILTVLIVLPRFTKKYYFRLNGNYYSDIFQIVDGSTYNNITNGSKNKKAPCNTFKTIFTPIRVFRLYKDLQDYNTKEIVRNTVYTTIIPIVFNMNVNCMAYLIANFGYYGVCDFLDIHCIQILDHPMNDKDWYSFEKHGIYICYPKICGNDPMVQSLAVTIYDGIRPNVPIDNLGDIRYWIQHLGKIFGNDKIDKGLFILDTLDGIYDILTHDELHLPECEKADIYYILRWMMREFNLIRKKNNVDISIKRYRIGEPIAAVLAKKLITGLSRASDMGKKITLYKVEKFVYSEPMFVIKNIINMSNLIAYRDMVNDNDALTALKYTYKGISGLGDSGTQIQQSYRYVDPSHAGIVDLDSSTTSDPGMSGTLCPLGKTYPGNSFSEYEEPNEWANTYKTYQEDYKKTLPEAITPFTFTEPIINEDLMKERKEVVEENIIIDKPICPITSTDGSIKFDSISYCLENEFKEDDNIKSLFNIEEDEDELEEDDYE